MTDEEKEELRRIVEDGKRRVEQQRDLRRVRCAPNDVPDMNERIDELYSRARPRESEEEERRRRRVTNDYLAKVRSTKT